MRRGEAIPKDRDGPIVICTRNDDLQGVLDATPSERHQGKSLAGPFLLSVVLTLLVGTDILAAMQQTLCSSRMACWNRGLQNAGLQTTRRQDAYGLNATFNSSATSRCRLHDAWSVPEECSILGLHSLRSPSPWPFGASTDFWGAGPRLLCCGQERGPAHRRQDGCQPRGPDGSIRQARTEVCRSPGECRSLVQGKPLPLHVHVHLRCPLLAPCCSSHPGLRRCWTRQTSRSQCWRS